MISIIMSTYNGARYLSQQLDSVLSQTVSDFTLLIRDDGSTDRTADIIRSYQDPRIVFMGGENVGPAKSFSILLQEAYRRGSDYVYFCDQDDIWQDDKLAQFQAAFSAEQQSPELVFSDFSMIDGNGAPIGSSYASWAKLRIPTGGDFFPKLLAQPYIFGCACAINRPLLELVQEMPDGIEMYDCWIGMVASLLGQIHYLPRPSIAHRFHSSNATGRQGQNALSSRLKRLTSGLAAQRDNTHLRLQQVALLRQHLGAHLPPHQQERLSHMESAIKKGGFSAAKMLRRETVYRGGMGQNLFFYLTILLQKGESL